MVVVSPLLRPALSLVIVTVGAIVSILMAAPRDAAKLSLPAASVNRAASTEIMPLALAFAVGMKVAE